MKKGQGSTEYLVILGAVLLIALVIVSLLGMFPSMSSSAKEQQSKTYWAGTTPFAVTSFKLNSTMMVLFVKNMLSERVNLTGIELGDQSNGTVYVYGSTGFAAQSYVFGPSEEVLLYPANSTYASMNFPFGSSIVANIPNPCNATGKVGSIFEFKNLSFIYTQGTIAGIRQTGTEPLVGHCS